VFRPANTHKQQSKKAKETPRGEGRAQLICFFLVLSRVSKQGTGQAKVVTMISPDTIRTVIGVIGELYIGIGLQMYTNAPSSFLLFSCQCKYSPDFQARGVVISLLLE
jgi:hypothetical protein